MLINDARDQCFITVKETKSLECCPHCRFRRDCGVFFVIGERGQGRCAKGFEAAGKGWWKDGEEMGAECEGVRVSNCISKSEIHEVDSDELAGAEGQARLLTPVWEPMQCTTQPGAERDLR